MENTLKLVIKEVKVTPRKPYDYNGRMNKKFRRNSTVFFFLEGEKVMENLLNRKSRPYNEYRKLLPEVLEQAGITEQKGNWNQYAGCSCPCSPGFKLQQDIGNDVYVTITMEEGE